MAIVSRVAKKSAANGIPAPNILSTDSSVGPLMLPLIGFHQIHLMACAVPARRYGARKMPRPMPEAQR